MNKEQIQALLELFSICIHTPLDTIEQEEQWKEVRHLLADIVIGDTELHRYVMNANMDQIYKNMQE